MSIERYGPYIEFRGDDGIRYVARVTSVALVADVDEMAAETYVSVAGKCILVRTPLEQIREALLGDGFFGSKRS